MWAFRDLHLRQVQDAAWTRLQGVQERDGPGGQGEKLSWLQVETGG